MCITATLHIVAYRLHKIPLQPKQTIERTKVRGNKLPIRKGLNKKELMASANIC